MQKRSDCEIFPDPVYFVLKFLKGVNYSYFHEEEQQASRTGLQAQ
jgi:hypothetical protein